MPPEACPDEVFNKLDIPEILNVLHIKQKNGQDYCFFYQIFSHLNQDSLRELMFVVANGHCRQLKMTYLRSISSFTIKRLKSHTGNNL